MQLTMQSNLIDIFTMRLNANTCNKRRVIYALVLSRVKSPELQQVVV